MPQSVSTLYSVPLAGSSGRDRESLLHYGQRLSVLHNLRVRDIFGKLIIPAAQIRGAFYVPGHFSLHSLKGCNGWSPTARALLRGLESLTLREDLHQGSLVAWGSVLHRAGYPARSVRWCPACLESTDQVGGAVYLLQWMFEPVRYCLTHQLSLAERCGKCGCAQPLLGDALARGLCERCFEPLYKAEPLTLSTSVASRLIFDAEAVVDMIDAIQSRRDCFPSGLFSKYVAAQSISIAGGSVERLEKLLNFTYRSLSSEKPPMLPRFFELLYRFDTKPSEFVAQTLKPIQRMRSISLYRTVRYRTSAERAALAIAAQCLLDQTLECRTRVTSKSEVASKLGISQATLKRHFPDLLERLEKHQRATRLLIRQQELEKVRTIVDTQIARLVSEGGRINSHSAHAALKDFGLSMRDPSVRGLVALAVKKFMAKRGG